MAYRYADIEGIMNRAMTDAGLDMDTLTDGQKVVELLEKKSDIDVKLFFEVQTMALEQAFKLAGGQRGKKGYYQDYSGERALWKGYGGDLISEGAGEQGGWVDGSKWHKLAWRGLHEEETKLQNNRQSAQTVGQVTGGAIVSAASIAATIVTAGAAAPAVAALMTAYAGMQTTIQVGSSFSSNRADQAWGQLQMGILQMGISGLGAFLGNVTYIADTGKLARAANAITQVLAQNTVSYAGSGFQMNEDGSIGYKGPSKGALYSSLVSTGFGAVGAGINAGTGAGGWQAGMVSTTANALGAGFQFNDDGSAGKYDWGKAGVSFAANTASTFASYGTQVAMKDAGYGRAASGVVANQVGRAANVLTASLLGDQNAYQAYMPQGFFSTVGTNLGDVLADRFNNRNSQRPSSPSQPLREIFGGATMITARREEEEHEDEQRFMRLLTLSDTAEAQDELAALAARGAINGEQYAAAARQILANGVKDGGTAKLPLVATNSDRLFGNLGKQYGASSEEMEFRYVMANNPGLDPNDGDAYAAARDNLRAKIEKGGVTINMPTGVGEYTGQTDKQFGYDTIRAERAAAAMAQLQNTAGVTHGTGFLLGMNTITGRQPLNLTPAQAFEMEKALAKIAPDVRAEREAAARQAQFENARSAYMWQQAGQLTLNATAGVLNNIATTLYAVPAPGIAYTTNAMAATAYTNMVANGRNWVKAFNNEFSEYTSNGAPAGAKPSIGGALAGSMPENWQIARGLAQGIDGMPMASTPMAMLTSGGVRAGAVGFLSSPENINGIINAATGIQINALTNPNVNWINTATAGVSNYAMGYMGTKFGMQTAPPLSVQFGRGALVGVLGDIGAQGLEKLIDPTYKEFDAFRTVMNMGATSLGTGFNAMMPSNAANAYASWAITKYPTIFSGLKTYTDNKTSQ